MLNKNQKTETSFSSILKRLWAISKHNWPSKLISLLIALFLWGALISEDASLTRQKTFNNVSINIINEEALLRNGYIVTEGLSDVPTIKFTAEVPQKMFDSASVANYNIRVDLSRIRETGKQKLPILYTSTTLYGNVSSISQSEIELVVDEYITRRRIPVQLEVIGSVPSGYYATPAGVEPPLVNISGPKELVQSVARCVARHDVSKLAPAARTQYTAADFDLYDYNNNVVDRSLIEVTSESVLLDTMLVEQALYLYRPVEINLSGLIVGEVANGYRIKSVTADPATIYIAASEDVLKSINLVDLDTTVDVSGISEKIIRSVKLKRPADAQYISQSSVYIIVEVEPE